MTSIIRLQNLLAIVILIVLNACKQTPESIHEKESIDNPVVAIVIHGGAGSITQSSLSVERELAYKQKLEEAINLGYSILEDGGSAGDAVEQTIKLLEDSPLFNAGKGAVFNSNGENELDASFMDGKTMNSGAVTGVKHIKNPIVAARRVMDSCKHVMLSGVGAEQFAEEQQLEIVDNKYFFTQDRYEGLINVKSREESEKEIYQKDEKRGTVGAVAIDKDGNIVAGTSTGGLTNKKYGRIGDSPIIGAGTYANNKTCGVSCTGVGEYFIRTLAAHDVSALMEYKGLSLEDAIKTVIDKIGTMGGDGGIIGLDFHGNVAWYFNTSGMFRGYKSSKQGTEVQLYGN